MRPVSALRTLGERESGTTRPQEAVAGRGSTLTARLLAFARKQELIPERIDIGELLSGMAEMLERSLGPTVTLDIKNNSPGLQLKADRNQLENAVLNGQRARCDADRGAIAIDASLFVTEEQNGPLKPGKYVCLRVTRYRGGHGP